MFEFINNFAGQNPFIDALGMFFAVWVIWIMAAYYVWYLFNESATTRYWHLAVVITTLALIYAVSFIIGYIWFEPRPFITSAVHLLIDRPWSQKSFPSDHAAVAFTLAMASWRLGSVKNWRRNYSPWFVAAFVALARVFVGVHYFLDVVAGAVLAVTLSWLIFNMFDKYLNRLRKVI